MSCPLFIPFIHGDADAFDVDSLFSSRPYSIAPPSSFDSGISVSAAAQSSSLTKSKVRPLVHTIAPSQSSSISSSSSSFDTVPDVSSAGDSSHPMFFLLHINGTTLSGSTDWRSRSDHIMLRLEANQVGRARVFPAAVAALGFELLDLLILCFLC